jgi:sulfite reductase (NADPH) flavoprotein alpha-component
VFSRDQVQRIYVQDRVREVAQDIAAWVAEGASIYVCGSLAGMAPAVDAALSDALGADVLLDLSAQGRYRRDIY